MGRSPKKLRKQKINSKKIQNMENKYHSTGKSLSSDKWCFTSPYEHLYLKMPAWASAAELINNVWYWKE